MGGVGGKSALPAGQSPLYSPLFPDRNPWTPVCRAGRAVRRCGAPPLTEKEEQELMRKNWLVLICSIVCLAGMAFADEGMWLFNVPPTAKIKAKYNFEVTQPWLDHVRLSSVRFNNGGSGSFVSP